MDDALERIDNESSNGMESHPRSVRVDASRRRRGSTFSRRGKRAGVEKFLFNLELDKTFSLSRARDTVRTGRFIRWLIKTAAKRA